MNKIMVLSKYQFHAMIVRFQVKLTHLYALYVDTACREQGVATKLLQSAEQQAKLNGVQVIGIEYDKEESESFVMDWYLRKGYKPFSKRSKLLIKELEDK